MNDNFFYSDYILRKTAGGLTSVIPTVGIWGIRGFSHILGLGWLTEPLIYASFAPSVYSSIKGVMQFGKTVKEFEKTGRKVPLLAKVLVPTTTAAGVGLSIYGGHAISQSIQHSLSSMPDTTEHISNDIAHFVTSSLGEYGQVMGHLLPFFIPLGITTTVMGAFLRKSMTGEKFSTALKESLKQYAFKQMPMYIATSASSYIGGKALAATIKDTSLGHTIQEIGKNVPSLSDIKQSITHIGQSIGQAASDVSQHLPSLSDIGHSIVQFVSNLF